MIKGAIIVELNKIYNQNCTQFIKQIEDNSIDLIIADPPI
jgi:DNA modification methylase